MCGNSCVAMYSRQVGLSELTNNMSFPFGSHKSQTSAYKEIR